MADQPKTDRVSLEELMVSTLAMTDAAVKLLIKKGVFTDRVQRPVEHRTGKER